MPIQALSQKARSGEKTETVEEKWMISEESFKELTRSNAEVIGVTKKVYDTLMVTPP